MGAVCCGLFASSRLSQLSQLATSSSKLCTYVYTTCVVHRLYMILCSMFFPPPKIIDYPDDVEQSGNQSHTRGWTQGEILYGYIPIPHRPAECSLHPKSGGLASSLRLVRHETVGELFKRDRTSSIHTLPHTRNSPMAGVEEELWNIFTFYTLRGNPLDLTRLSVR